MGSKRREPASVFLLKRAEQAHNVKLLGFLFNMECVACPGSNKSTNAHPRVISNTPANCQILPILPIFQSFEVCVSVGQMKKQGQKKKHLKFARFLSISNALCIESAPNALNAHPCMCQQHTNSRVWSQSDEGTDRQMDRESLVLQKDVFQCL